MTSPMDAEVKELKVLRERTEKLLSQAQAAVFANGRYRPGLARLCGELEGLRESLDDLTTRQIAVEAVYDSGYERGQESAASA